MRSLSRGHEVSLLAFAFATAAPAGPEPLPKWCAHVDALEVDPFAAQRGGALRTFLSPSPMTYRALPAMSQLAVQAFHKQDFDVVIASTAMMAEYALQARPNTTRILEEHNSLTRWMHERYAGQSRRSAQRLRSWASWQKTRRYEAGLFRRFDLVTMVSRQDRDVCLTDLPGYEGRVEIVPNGVDCEHNLPGLATPRPFSLVYNGSLTYGANYDAMRWFLADIYPTIRAQAPNVSLSITGATTGVNLRGLALDNSVTLTGFVPDVRPPVGVASVCVVPIRQGGGTRLKILEAMALGTPVVATSKGAEGLEVVDGEHLLLGDDPASFARCTVELLTDPGLRARLAANARRLVETRYDWDQIGAQFVSLVEEVVARRASTG